MAKTISISSLRTKLNRIMSEFVRKRDFVLGCISCGQHVNWENWQAGHFYDKSISYAGLYFHPKNINGQCKTCNELKDGNKDEYEKALVLRYGPEVLEELAVEKMSYKPWNIFQYEEAIKKYSAILKGNF